MNIPTPKCQAVANYIIEETINYNKQRSFYNQVRLSTKRLQKLLYFCDAEHMRINNGKPLFEDNFYAWPHGPVIESVYPLFMPYIDGELRTVPLDNEVTLTKNEKLLINQILDAANNLDTIDLVDISKVVGGPHNKVYKEDDIQHKQIILKYDTYSHYSKYEILKQLKKGKAITPSLYQDEIIKLQDEQLQLQYILGGLYPHGNYNCDVFWECDIRCPTLPVDKDENFKKVQTFIAKHNISNSTFLRLARSYLFSTINSYKGDWGTLIPELDSAIVGYNFKHTNYQSFKENDLQEKALLKLIKNEANKTDSELNKFLSKYSLTTTDFIILAKTSINYKFKIARGFNKTDLHYDLQEILTANDLYHSYELVKWYRDRFQEQTLLEDKPKSLVKRIKNRKKNY